MHLSESIGSRLQAERKRLGLNQEQFAERLSVSKRTQAGYEAGTSDPSATYLESAANLFGIDVKYVLIGNRSSNDPGSLEQDEALVLQQYRSIPGSDKEVIKRILSAMAELANQVK